MIDRMSDCVRAAFLEIERGDPSAAAVFLVASGAASGCELAPSLQMKVAGLVPGLPNDLKNDLIGFWAADILAKTPKEFLGRSSTVRNSTLEQLQKALTAVDESLVEEIEAVLDSEMEKVLRSAGVQIVASIRDPKLKKDLESFDLGELACRSNDICLSNGRSVMAITQIDLQKIVDKAAARIEKAVEKILEDHIERILAAVSDVSGFDLLDDQPGLIAATALLASTVFAEQVVRRLNGELLPDGQVDVRDQATAGFGRGWATFVAANLAGVTSGLLSERFWLQIQPRLQLLGDQIFDAASRTETLLRAGEDVPSALKRQLESLRAGKAGGLAEALGRGGVVRTSTVWVHGSPANPFPPHENLDGVVVGSVEYDSRSVEPYSFSLKSGEPRSTAPFLGEWRPGDHAGCTCFFRSERVLVLEGG